MHNALHPTISYGAKWALPRCTHVPSLVSLAQSFLKPEDPMSKKRSASGACSLRPTGTAPQRILSWGGMRVTCEFEVGSAPRLTCRGAKKFLQAFTRRHVHVPRATNRPRIGTIIVPAERCIDRWYPGPDRTSRSGAIHQSACTDTLTD